MFVDRKKIRYTILKTGATINIPIRMDFTPIDNSELVEDKFVRDEIEKVINPIVDYKKLIFKPASNAPTWNIINKFKIVLNFFTPDNLTYSNTYNVLNFLTDDLFCRSPRLMNSFLRLTFYDTTNSSTNRVLGFNDIYTQVGKDQKNAYGLALPSNQSPISYTVGDSVLEPDTVHEGYNLYWYQDLVDNSPNKTYAMYMTATYNNATNGQSMRMYATPTTTPNDIQMVDVNASTGPLFIKVVLKNDKGVYKYRFESNNPKQDIQNGGGLNLSPYIGIPTINFWQIAP
jgi:hypothetical protein